MTFPLYQFLSNGDVKISSTSTHIPGFKNKSSKIPKTGKERGISPTFMLKTLLRCHVRLASCLQFYLVEFKSRAKKIQPNIIEVRYMEGEKMNLKVVLKPNDQGGFKAYVPSLPGCGRKGMSEEEALRNVRTAVLQHFGIEEILHAPHGYPCGFRQMESSLCRG